LRAGEKIAPQEVEAELQRHPDVRDVAVVGLPDPLLGEKSHAFVILVDAAQPLTTANARAFLRRRGLAEFKLPDAVHVVTELPRTKVGKTDRAALRARTSLVEPPTQVSTWQLLR
jgi:2,3-dihydroxybenzoate-AMP ligase